MSKKIKNKLLPANIFGTTASNKYLNPALQNDFSFKIMCLKSTFLTVHFPIQVDVWIHSWIEGFQSTFSSKFFKNKIPKDPFIFM